MGWISKFLRRATIEIDKVPTTESPVSNGAGITWATIGAEFGWDNCTGE